jgi:hypothetical protein
LKNQKIIKKSNLPFSPLGLLDLERRLVAQLLLQTEEFAHVRGRGGKWVI